MKQVLNPAAQESYWHRHRVALSAFWPVALLLLAFDAVSDYGAEVDRKKKLRLAALEEEIREMQVSIGKDFDRKRVGSQVKKIVSKSR